MLGHKSLEPRPRCWAYASALMHYIIRAAVASGSVSLYVLSGAWGWCCSILNQTASILTFINPISNVLKLLILLYIIFGIYICIRFYLRFSFFRLLYACLARSLAEYTERSTIVCTFAHSKPHTFRTLWVNITDWRGKAEEKKRKKKAPSSQPPPSKHFINVIDIRKRFIVHLISMCLHKLRVHFSTSCRRCRRGVAICSFLMNGLVFLFSSVYVSAVRQRWTTTSMAHNQLKIHFGLSLSTRMAQSMYRAHDKTGSK